MCDEIIKTLLNTSCNLVVDDDLQTIERVKETMKQKTGPSELTLLKNQKFKSD